jgi:hypothetical protein
MDIFQMLRDFISGGDSKPQPTAQGRKVTPGYEEAARRYESAFDRGDYNSPDVIGQDPKNFGYPPEQKANTNRILGSVNPIWQIQNRQTPYGLQGFTPPRLSEEILKRRY